MTVTTRPKPQLAPEYCKGCLRCIDACAKDCITRGEEILPATGVMPVVLDLTDCNGCGLCIQACPEPYGLVWGSCADVPCRTPSGGTPTPPRPGGDEPVPAFNSEGELSNASPSGAGFELEDPAKLFGAKAIRHPAEDRPDRQVPLPPSAPLVVKGTYASAIGALLAGCRHVFGYPITPSTEGAELMAKLLPKLGGSFVQAVSEVAAINMMYGCGGAGLPSMTFTSGPGLSLMLEGISYMIGAELPGVVANIMRGGPGLGNIAPEQSDIKLVCRGLGHGNSHALVLAPSTPQEMLDLTLEAFRLSFKYRNPVILLADGYLGQMTGKVALPDHMVEPGLPGWAVSGDREHRGNLITSIYLGESDLEAHNAHLNGKYAEIGCCEQRSESYRCEDADVLLVACHTPARMAKGAVEFLRARGLRAGLFRPITLWPFPVDALAAHLPHVKRLVVVEASPGQLEDELRLALSHRNLAPPPISSVRRQGGFLPQEGEIVAHVTKGSKP